MSAWLLLPVQWKVSLPAPISQSAASLAFTASSVEGYSSGSNQPISCQPGFYCQFSGELVVRLSIKERADNMASMHCYLPRHASYKMNITQFLMTLLNLFSFLLHTVISYNRFPFSVSVLTPLDCVQPAITALTDQIQQKTSTALSAITVRKEAPPPLPAE